ncbi:MAG: winged helix-turn-helix domain-containing protein [Hyphomicrobiaceae bacterium]
MKLLTFLHDRGLTHQIEALASRLGCDVTRAATIYDCEETLKHENFEAVFVEFSESTPKEVFDLPARVAPTPAIAFIGRSRTHDATACLHRGYRDFIRLPLDPQTAVIRMRRAILPPELKPPFISRVGQLTYDRLTATISHNGEPLHLPPRELRILIQLMTQQPCGHTARQIRDALVGPDSELDEPAIHTQIARLRKRIEGCGVEIRTTADGYRIFPL